MSTKTTYDIDLNSTGNAWMGTFGVLVTALVTDLVSDGPEYPTTVEIRFDDDQTHAGVVGFGAGDDVITVGNLAIEVERINRIRV